MKCEKAVIDELANEIMKQHSFQCDSFPDAKVTIKICNAEYMFDKLSMCVYSHNLDEEDYSYLRRQLIKRYDAEHNRDDHKIRTEYVVLFNFMSVTPEYLDMTISKTTRPDFVLYGIKKIGVEVTEFTTQEDSVLNAISRQNFGLGKTVKEIKNNAIKRHGKKANNYTYHNLDSTAGIDSGIFDVGAKKIIYANIIKKKYDLYHEMFTDFDEFILLCDARYSICVTDKGDSDDVIKLVREKQPNIHGFSLCVLRENADGVLVVDKYIL